MKTRRVNHDVPDPTYRKMKAYAAENGLKVGEALDVLLSQALGLRAPEPDNCTRETAPPYRFGTG